MKSAIRGKHIVKCVAKDKSDRAASHPRRRRRHRQPDHHRAGAAQALRPGLPGAGKAVGGGGAGRAPPPQGRRASGGPHPRRPADAGDARHGVPRRGAPHRPGRQARHAGLVGRAQLAAGDPRWLRRGPDRVLHHQAVAHRAGRALPPRDRRLPLRVGTTAAPCLRGRPPRRRALGPALERAPRPARPQRRRVRLLRRRLRGGKDDPARRRRRRGAAVARGRGLRRPHPGRSQQPRGGGVAGRAQPAVRRRVRSAHRRRGAGRPRRGRLRLFRGPQYRGARA